MSYSLEIGTDIVPDGADIFKTLFCPKKLEHLNRLYMWTYNCYGFVHNDGGLILTDLIFLSGP